MARERVSREQRERKRVLGERVLGEREHGGEFRNVCVCLVPLKTCPQVYTNNTN